MHELRNQHVSIGQFLSSEKLTIVIYGKFAFENLTVRSDDIGTFLIVSDYIFVFV